jgi:hypothetical protein
MMSLGWSVGDILAAITLAYISPSLFTKLGAKSDY